MRLWLGKFYCQIKFQFEVKIKKKPNHFFNFLNNNKYEADIYAINKKTYCIRFQLTLCLNDNLILDFKIYEDFYTHLQSGM